MNESRPWRNGPAIEGSASIGRPSSTAGPSATAEAGDAMDKSGGDDAAQRNPIVADVIISRRNAWTATGDSRADLCARALVIWPRLDRARMTRTRGDPARIARLVAGRTSLTFDCILATLTRGQGRDPE